MLNMKMTMCHTFQGFPQISPEQHLIASYKQYTYTRASPTTLKTSEIRLVLYELFVTVKAAPHECIKAENEACFYSKVTVSSCAITTQVNRMSKSRTVLATGGKQRSFGLHMVCFEMVLYHNEPH